MLRHGDAGLVRPHTGLIWWNTVKVRHCWGSKMDRMQSWIRTEENLERRWRMNGELNGRLKNEEERLKEYHQHDSRLEVLATFRTMGAGSFWYGRRELDVELKKRHHTWSTELLAWRWTIPSPAWRDPAKLSCTGWISSILRLHLRMRCFNVTVSSYCWVCSCSLDHLEWGLVPWVALSWRLEEGQ